MAVVWIGVGVFIGVAITIAALWLFFYICDLMMNA